MSRAALFVAIATICVWTSCAARSGPPLSALALDRPNRPISQTAARHPVNQQHPRGGFYLLNWGFRPAAPLDAYLAKAHEEAGADVLRDADVVLAVPAYFDILLFGYNMGVDEVYVESTD